MVIRHHWASQLLTPKVLRSKLQLFIYSKTRAVWHSSSQAAWANMTWAPLTGRYLPPGLLLIGCHRNHNWSDRHCDLGPAGWFRMDNRDWWVRLKLIGLPPRSFFLFILTAGAQVKRPVRELPLVWSRAIPAMSTDTVPNHDCSKASGQYLRAHWRSHSNKRASASEACFAMSEFTGSGRVSARPAVTIWNCAPTELAERSCKTFCTWGTQVLSKHARKPAFCSSSSNGGLPSPRLPISGSTAKLASHECPEFEPFCYM